MNNNNNNNKVWTTERLDEIVLLQEQGTVLESTDAVKSGTVTVGAILAAGNREFGFGRHKLKDGSGHILLPNVKFHKAKRALKEQDDEKPAEVITAPDSLADNGRTVIIGEARPTAVTAGASDILEALQVLKSKTLEEIIASFIVLSKDFKE